MALTPLVVLAMAAHCAPAVSPTTLISVVRVESGFDPFAIGVNGPRPARLHPKTLIEAVDVATRMIASGANIDLDLGQINATNLAPLGLRVADAFDPCRNLQASSAILQQAYQIQSPHPGTEQTALRVALSLYNTGRTDRGFRNGYVAKVRAAARAIVPPLEASPPAAPALPPPDWDVFAQASGSARNVFTSTEKDRP